MIALIEHIVPSFFDQYFMSSMKYESKWLIKSKTCPVPPIPPPSRPVSSSEAIASSANTIQQSLSRRSRFVILFYRSFSNASLGRKGDKSVKLNTRRYLLLCVWHLTDKNANAKIPLLHKWAVSCEKHVSGHMRTANALIRALAVR